MDNELENSKETGNENKPSEQPKAPDNDKQVKALQAEIEKLKQAVTNASADASKYKKELQAKQTDEERAKAEQAEANAAMQKELEDLRNERNIANFTGTLTAPDIGMDMETAKAVAIAMNSGETDKVFDGIRKFIASHDKQLAEKAMLNNPTLPGGNSTKTVTREEFNNMGYKETLAFKHEHPDLYNEYTK